MLTLSSSNTNIAPAEHTVEPAPPPVVLPADPAQIHRMVMDAFDDGKYDQTVRLLESFKTTYPDRYGMLPYVLLQARAEMLSGDLTSAAAQYKGLLSDSRFARYATLPLARIAAKQDRVSDAIQSYLLYLSHADYPSYPMIALETFRYCVSNHRGDDLMTASAIISRNNPGLRRIATYYSGRAYRIKGDLPRATQVFNGLLRNVKADDAASLALTDLDEIEGAHIPPGELIFRGRLAYTLWNFSLAKKYLQSVAFVDIKNAYYYARALYFLGDVDGAKQTFQKALAMWPKDPWRRFCLEQYANIFLKEGDAKSAETIFAKDKFSDASNFRLIQLLRGESRFADALRLLEPYTRSKKKTDQAKALFLRARIYYQQGSYRESFTDLNTLQQKKSTGIDQHEVQYWKAFILEKLQLPEEANQIYNSLAENPDFFGFLARKKLPGGHNIQALPEGHQCALDISEQDVANRYVAGQDASALLYLHLYDEFGESLSKKAFEQGLIPGDNSRSSRLLEMAHVAGLSKDYVSANFYSELFMKATPGPHLAFSTDTLRILFPWPYRDTIQKFAQEYKVDPLFVLSIMRQESRFKPLARSQVFARGLMQLIPSTAVSVAGKVGLADFDPDQLYIPDVNVNLGTRYIEEMIHQFGNRMEVLAASYNGGETNARLWLSATSSDDPIEFYSNIDFGQTRDYVRQVLVNYDYYRRIYGQQLTASKD